MKIFVRYNRSRHYWEWASELNLIEPQYRPIEDWNSKRPRFLDKELLNTILETEFGFDALDGMEILMSNPTDPFEKIEENETNEDDENASLAAQYLKKYCKMNDCESNCLTAYGSMPREWEI